MSLLLKPLKPSPSTAATSLRHFSADLHSSPPSPTVSTNPFHQTLTLLKTTSPTSWSTDPNLLSLLPSLTAHLIHKITRQLPNYQHALHFFNHLKRTPNLSDHLPPAFQAVIEHAVTEYSDDHNKLREIFALSKEQGIPIPLTASIILIRSFARVSMLPEMMTVYDSIEKESRNTQLYNVVIDGLLRSGSVDDAFMLLDEMLEKETSAPPDSKTVDIVFSNVLRRNSMGRRVSDDEICKFITRFGEHGVSPKGYWFTQLITRFCRNGECDKAWAVVHDVMDSGCSVDVSSCNALLTVLGRARDYKRMNLLMEEMNEKNIKPDVITYGIMIKRLCRDRRVDQALEVLEKMKDGDFGVEPDVIIYNSLIDGLCKVGRQEEGLKLMERMRLESSCCADVVTYNCLIDGFCKVGEIDRGCELFEKMNEEGMEMNVVTFNTLLDGMCKHGRVSSAMEIFGRMGEKGVKGNSVTYTTLITAFCYANNIEKAMKLFDEMQGNGYSPDAILYYSLISGLSQARRMNDASYIVSKMKESGFCLDLLSYNVLINGFCRTNKLDKASETLKEMEEAGVKPDRVTYNTLISFFCNKEDFAQAHRLMKKMIDDGLSPNVVTYGALIHGFCLKGDLKVAMKLFRDLSSSKIQPNTVIYNMLIDALCKTDDVEGAISLMDDMKERKVKPDSITYNAILKGLQQRNLFEKALEYMDQMTEEECNPDYVTMGILTEWLSAVGETDKLRKFVQECNVSGTD